MIKTYLIFIFSYILTFLLTYFGVERFRQWTLKRELFDIPNDRSSHTQPTPRGGGLVIFFVCLGIFAVYSLIFDLEKIWAYFAGAIIIGLISWLDDLYEVSVVWRFLAHSIAASLVIFSFGFWETIYFPFVGEIFVGRFGILLTFFGIVWLINAYNFMDGIDGIAGVQAVAAGIGWLFVGILWNINSVAFYGIIIALSSLAFLLHNWQPAKIFMGDVGSAFLGYTFAVMPLLAMPEVAIKNKSYLPMIGVVTVSAFVFDSIWTFSKRLSRLEKVWKPHREHIYQQLVISGFSHQRVTLLYLVISLIGNGLLIIWITQRQIVGDFPLIIILLLLFCLLFYSFRKKNLT